MLLTEHVVGTSGLELSETSSEFILQLMVSFSHFVLESTSLGRLSDDTSVLLEV